MIKIGKLIKSARTSKNIPIDQVSKELKISEFILKNIENDEKIKNNEVIFYIGHIRSYSNYLELDSDEIVVKFKDQISFKKNEVINKIAKPTFQHELFNFQKLFSLSVILIIFTSFYMLFVKEKDNSINYALIPELPEIYDSVIESEQLNILNNTKDSLKENNQATSYLNANASKNLDQQDINTKITLKILNSTWLQIRDESNNIILSRLMDKDEEYMYDMNDGYNITAGNAGNILVMLNKVVIGKIGKYGEVVDSIIIDNTFKN